MKRKILACLLSLSLLVLTLAPATGSFASEVEEGSTADSFASGVEEGSTAGSFASEMGEIPTAGSFASEVEEIPTADSLTGEVEDVPATVEPTSQAAEVTQAVPEEKSTPEPTPESTPEPTPESTSEATPEPTPDATPEPTSEPTPEPTAEPTPLPEELPELCAIVQADAAGAFEGDEIGASVLVSGGLAPYSVQIAVECGGEVLAEQAIVLEDAGSASIRATAVYGTANFTARVEDALGSEASGGAQTRIARHDGESRAQWEATLAAAHLSGDWREDVLAIAYTQLGYRESDCDFIIDEADNAKGYTRYGDWYGADYADWCAMFVAFCLNYAGVSHSDCPWDAGCEAFRGNLRACGAYVPADEYAPQSGDLIFFSTGSGGAGHMGIVTGASGSSVYTIEGNSANMVRECSYSLRDPDILGYGDLAELMRQAGVLAAETPAPSSTVEPDSTPAPVIDAGGTVLVEPSSFVPGETRLYESTASMQLSGGEGSVQDVVLPQSGRLELRASGSGSAQWQIYSPDAQLWVGIAGETSPTLFLTYAKVCSLLSGGTVRLRCAFAGADSTRYSATARVSVRPDAEAEFPQIEETDADAPALMSLAPAAAAADAPAQTCTVVINYVFEDNTPVAEPYTATLAAGSDFSATVPNPSILGYLPYVDGAAESSGIVQLDVADIRADQTHTVVYKPTAVNYTVIHYLQNLGDDNYAETARETKQGLTNSNVPEAARAYDGFYALLYDRPAIAADGSTVVEVYYDRCYYLMRFDLGGGYGVEPIYARYGAPIDVSAPVRQGYTFDGWTRGGADASLPATMPAENRSYAAKWTAAEASFTAVYWLQNADDDDYSVFGSATIDATTDETILPENCKDFRGRIPIDANLEELLPFMEFDHADGEVSVAGDRSTVVNLYYARRAFTLKFYYAMEDVDREKYYIIGGSSYKFGASGASTDDSLDNLTNYYMDGGSSVVERGEVDEIPALNSAGAARSYATGSDSASKTVNGVRYNYRYHYLSFRARYGADISSMWPCDVLNSVTRLDKTNSNGWEGTEAFFSAWNGEHHVWYSQHNANQTIKGNYNRLDAQLLWEADKFGDYADASGTVDYLGFWENGANVKWNVPKLFRYRIWVPLPEGESAEGLTTKTREGVTYILRSVYDTCDNSTVKEQTAPEIDGLTYLNNITPTSKPVQGVDYAVITDFDTSLYKEAYEVNFYYARNLYTLAFYSAGEVVASESIAFEQDISDRGFAPDYPAGYEANAFEFDGWYSTASFAAGTEVDFSGMRMPANDLLIYARWKPTSHTVRFYLNREKLELGEQLTGYEPRSVLHGSLAGEVADPVNGAYVFVGWFHLDGGVEKAFDFDNMPVTADLSVYGRWSSNTLKDYAVYYRALDDGAEVASPTLGSALAGITRTFEAKGGDALHPAYREGYFPTVRSHSITLDIEDDAANSYTFWYVARDAVPYTVRYLDADTGEPVAPEKLVSDNRKAVVTENFVPVSGMVPDAYQKRLVVRADAGGDSDDNVIVFYYSADTEHAYYRIIHYVQSSDGISWREHASSQAKGTIGQVYSASPMTIPGYSFDSSVAGTRTSGELTADGLELKLYYRCNAYPYEVRYLEEGTNLELAQSKPGSALYGSVVSASAIEIEGYSLVSASPQTLTVRIESGDAAQLNVIRFYYARIQTASLTIHKSITGALEKDACFVFNISGNGLDLDVLIQENGSVTIDGLTVGKTYSVREISGNWRYDLDDSAHSVTLQPGGNSVSFSNVHTKDRWLDDNAYSENAFNAVQEECGGEH